MWTIYCLGVFRGDAVGPGERTFSGFVGKSQRCHFRQSDLYKRSRLLRLENALPDGAAKLFPAEVRVDDDHRKLDQHRRSLQLETIARRLAGEFGNDITADEGHRHKIEKTGESPAPKGLDQWGRCLIGHETLPLTGANLDGRGESPDPYITRATF